MKAKLFKHRSAIVLGLVLALLLIGNIWLFAPRFIQQNQELTVDKLNQQQQILSETARDASEIISRVSQRNLSRDDAKEQLESLQNQTDSAILILRTSKHQVDITDEVGETLELAELLSFTLRTYTLSSDRDSLSSAQTAQVLLSTSEKAQRISPRK